MNGKVTKYHLVGDKVTYETDEMHEASMAALPIALITAGVSGIVQFTKYRFFNRKYDYE